MKYKVTVTTPFLCEVGLAIDLLLTKFDEPTIDKLIENGYDIIKVEKLDA